MLLMCFKMSFHNNPTGIAMAVQGHNGTMQKNKGKTKVLKHSLFIVIVWI